MEKYVSQITTDAVNQYNGQYTQIIANEWNYEFFKYDNTDILSTRPWCDAMTDQPYFHISQLPKLITGTGLTYMNKKTGKREPVPINQKTGLPTGMIPGTDSNNIFIRRGGYNCGHQIRPVNEKQVPADILAKIKASPEYIAWKEKV
jgi:hypothetical protein